MIYGISLSSPNILLLPFVVFSLAPWIYSFELSLSFPHVYFIMIPKGCKCNIGIPNQARIKIKDEDSGGKVRDNFLEKVQVIERTA